MERESFEDEATATYLNARFIAIKVDREERPDLDQIYMGAVQALTGGGGWPMSVFLTPEGRPFYGGTYFPPVPRHGLPSFRQVLEGIDRAWREQRAELEQSAGAARRPDLAPQVAERRSGGATPTPALLDAAVGADRARLRRDERRLGRGAQVPAADDDRVPAPARGGAGPARAADGATDARRDGRRRHPRPARRRLPSLRDGRDLAGARTSSRCSTTTPSSPGSYLHAWALTGDARYREVATGTLDFMVRELTTADGAFAASQDADTEGVEGATFTWRAAEVRAALGDDAALFSTAYGVTDGGNWEGATILSRVRPAEELARLYGLAAADVEAPLGRRASGCSRSGAQTTAAGA